MAEQVEKSNNIDARVAEARQQIGKMISSRRVGSGQRQQDIWDKTGLNATSQSRIESGTSNYGIDNLLTMLIGIDMLDSFMESIESSLASAEETRRRVKVVNVDPELTNGNIPLGTQTFIALMEQDPSLELPITKRAIGSVRKAGYVLRTGELHGEETTFATTVQNAEFSSHIYVDRNGVRYGGVKRLKAVLARSELSAVSIALFDTPGFPEMLMTSINARFDLDGEKIRMVDITVGDVAEHTITIDGTDEVIKPLFVYDVVISCLNNLSTPTER